MGGAWQEAVVLMSCRTRGIQVQAFGVATPQAPWLCTLRVCEVPSLAVTASSFQDGTLIISRLCCYSSPIGHLLLHLRLQLQLPVLLTLPVLSRVRNSIGHIVPCCWLHRAWRSTL